MVVIQMDVRRLRKTTLMEEEDEFSDENDTGYDDLV